ncbi:DNA repair protein RecN [Gluconacetobacter diazotrophicus PA1 5]|uniref:DNA repair protein RecN n=1 Tax=Gluconacetobacter diazotrophicus TaxID=33996 RepID=A0A7W4FCT3_GLUDI|nr:DNA repair protein RecN [Gluconacetobacter diazotrophicus]ACI52891.1 DNA repair protein RecN [Gluconacetobacter diazotrophicus PA1 5]MBB2155370.1 DNA repair protein RecN [Gluconacetobacter diazotrophicus]
MLTHLSIRDVVLIERLDLPFSPGLTVLTGETGAGKSILLDSLGLTLGERASAGLVRAGAEQASVTACFELAPGHPLPGLLAEQGILIDDPRDPLVLRRIVTVDGRSRAYINDQPAGVTLLRRAASLLVEIQGQHEQMGLADQSTHLDLLDAFGVPADLRADTAAAYRAWMEATAELAAAQAAMENAAREEDWLRQSVEDLSSLAPQEDEETHLAGLRQSLQQGERRGEAIAAALAELSPRDRRATGPAAALRGASRTLQRLLPAAGEDDAAAGGADRLAHDALAALERAEEALGEAETLLSRLAADAESDPHLLEQTEERLFALRAAARKHGVSVPELPGLLAAFADRLAALDSGNARIGALQEAVRTRRARFEDTAGRLSAARETTARRLEQAVTAELRPLRLERARFFVSLPPLPPEAWTARGREQAAFQIAANPGQPPGPLAKVASGGELSRLMLALKVVLAGRSAVPTLVFDEVDSGVGGATASAIGDRLARVGHDVQVLVVTHSPQVAARGDAHLRISKSVTKGRTETRAEPLSAAQRREEIARMLAGDTITEAARAAADSLLQG